MTTRIDVFSLILGVALALFAGGIHCLFVLWSDLWRKRK